MLTKFRFSAADLSYLGMLQRPVLLSYKALLGGFAKRLYQLERITLIVQYKDPDIN